ncbi:MAG: hypothetical protein HZB29_04230 [Nitrospinae bacterium]|nr:hypothetical protein [Nitrospinota bacterium]
MNAPASLIICIAALLTACASVPERQAAAPFEETPAVFERGPVPSEFTLPPDEMEIPHNAVNKSQRPPKQLVNLQKAARKAPDGKRISLNLAEPSMETVAAVLGEASGMRIALDPEAAKIAPAPVKLLNVTWIEALEVIANANNLVALAKGEDIFEGGAPVFSDEDLVTITTRAKHLASQEARLKSGSNAAELAERRRKAAEERQAAIEAAGAGAMLTKSYRFQYADPAEAADYLERLLVEYDRETLKNITAQGALNADWSAAGSTGQSRQTLSATGSKDAAAVIKVRRGEKGDVRISVYRPENMITISAPARKMGEIMKAIEEIDVKPRQVYIEARIVEIQRNKVRDLGIQWGGNANYTTNLGFPNTIGIGGSGGNLVSLAPQSAVDAATGQALSNPAGAAAEVSVGSVNGAALIRARLFALEKAGVSKTLSNPKVMAINGAKASIKSGKEIPYQSSSANTGVTVLFKEAVISLNVTPLVMSGNRVRLKIEAKKDEVDPNLSVQGTPAIRKREIITSVVVDSGGSAVLGGMIEGEDGDFSDRVPGLHDTPVLGWLFKNDRKVDNELELLVFITPTIVEQGG